MKDMITSKTFEEHAKGKGIMARSCLSARLNFGIA